MNKNHINAAEKAEKVEPVSKRVIHKLENLFQENQGKKVNLFLEDLVKRENLFQENQVKGEMQSLVNK